MFEEEAEIEELQNLSMEKAKKHILIPHTKKEEIIYANGYFLGHKEGFQKGEEFGYKKGFEECAKARLNVTTISDCPIKDEWHFVKNRDFPVREDYYVIACHSATGDFTDRCQWLGNEWWGADGETKHFINEKVYAWKEKPEPPEEI